MFFIPIPAFADHGLCWFHDGKRAVVVDPGDAKPVLSTLEEPTLPLKPILVTRRHADRTTGMDELRQGIGVMAYGRETQPTGQVLRLCANGRSRPSAIVSEAKIKTLIPTRQATIMAAAQRLDASVHGDISLFTAIRQ